MSSIFGGSSTGRDWQCGFIGTIDERPQRRKLVHFAGAGSVDQSRKARRSRPKHTTAWSFSPKQASCSTPMRSKEQGASAGRRGVLEAPTSARWRRRHSRLLLLLLLCSGTLAPPRVAACSCPNGGRRLLATAGPTTPVDAAPATEDLLPAARRDPRPAAAAQQLLTSPEPTQPPPPAVAQTAADVFQLPVASPPGSAPPPAT